MSKSHLEKLRTELAKSKWIIHTDTSTNEIVESWEISKPNGDYSLKMRFSICGNGKYGAHDGSESMDNACGCSIEGHPQIDIYFGKYSGQFQKDLAQFISQLNQIEKNDLPTKPKQY